MGRYRSATKKLLRHPGLWPEAVRAAIAMTPKRWWSRPPRLPLPDHRYLSWRLGTAYGRVDADLSGEDLVAYLRWRREIR